MKKSTKVIGVILVLGIIGFVTEDKEPKLIKSEEPVSQTIVEKEISTPVKQIDLVHQLHEQIESIVNNYTYPYPSFKKFSQYKFNAEKLLTPICDDYLKLVKQTGGNVESKYFNESVDCQNTKLSLMVVLFGIRDNDVNSINEQKQKLLTIDAKLVKQLDEYRETPEYKAEMEKYLVGS